jgi:drug/metabolite transporter (DMT)-like permease
MNNSGGWLRLRRAYLSVFLACFLWSWSFIAAKLALEAFTPLTLVFGRLLLASLCFLLWFVSVKRWPFPGQGISFGMLTLLALLGTVFHFGAQTIGLQTTSAANASVYVVTGPIGIALIAAVFLKESLNLRRFMGIALAVAGVLVTMGRDQLGHVGLSGPLWGDLLVLLSILMWSVFTVLSKHSTKTVHPIDLTGSLTLLGTAFMVPLVVLGDVLLPEWFQVMKLVQWKVQWSSAGAGLVFLGVGCSFLATLLYVKALACLESQQVGIFLYTIPPMTFVFSSVVLGEAITWPLIFGCALVLLGVVLTQQGNRKAGN